MSLYSIKDLEQLSGIKAHTLRIWEQRYNFIKPERTGTNIRLYCDSDLKLVLNVSLLKDNGFKISRIAEMSHEEMGLQVSNITSQELKYPDQVNLLCLAMIDMDEDRFEKIIATNSIHHGFENTMMNIIYPFLQKIGILWQTGSINPAHEHFISSLVRQKLIVAIDAQMDFRKSVNPKRFMLFLPQSELHEIGLLFSHYLIRSRGNRSLYLGQNLPLEDVAMAYEVYKPQYLFTILTGPTEEFQIETYLEKLAAACPEAEILVTGQQIIGQDIKLPGSVRAFHRIQDLTALLHA